MKFEVRGFRNVECAFFACLAHHALCLRLDHLPEVFNRATEGIFELPLNLKRSHFSYAHTDEDVDRLLEGTEAAVTRYLDTRA